MRFTTRSPLPMALWAALAVLSVAGAAFVIYRDSGTTIDAAGVAVEEALPAPPSPLEIAFEDQRRDLEDLLRAAGALREENDALRRRLTAVEAEVAGLNANTILKGRLDRIESGLADVATRLAATQATAAAASNAAAAASSAAAAAIENANRAAAAAAAATAAAAMPPAPPVREGAAVGAGPAQPSEVDVAAAPQAQDPVGEPIDAAGDPAPPVDPTPVAAIPAVGDAPAVAAVPEDIAGPLPDGGFLQPSRPEPEGDAVLQAAEETLGEAGDLDPAAPGEALPDPLVTAAIDPTEALGGPADPEEELGDIGLLPPGPPATPSPRPSRTFIRDGRTIIPLPPPSRPETGTLQSSFGLDLGGAPDRNSALALWAYLLNLESGQLSHLQPLMQARTTPGGTEMRLILGPFADAADAAAACARLQAGGTSCSTTLYSGEPFSQP